MRIMFPSVAFVASLALALAACGQKNEPPAAKPALTVTASKAVEKPIARSIVVSGTVVAWQELPVGAEVNGLAIVDVPVEEGDSVVKGQLLARLNDSVLRAQFRQHEASLDSSRAAFAEADANLKRAEALKEQGFVSGQAVDARLAAARSAAANVVMAEASKAEIEARLAQTRIVARANGYISSRSAVIGQIVAAGTELFRIVRDSRLELKAEVPETELPLLREGLAARVTAEGVPVAEGAIRLVASSVDSRTRLGAAYIALPDGAGYRPGMFARAVIASDTAPALVAPQNSVVFREGKSGLFLLDEANRVRFRPVVTGARTGGDIEVVSGIESGDRIAVQGAGLLEDGDLVEVVGGAAARQAEIAPAAR